MDPTVLGAAWVPFVCPTVHHPRGTRHGTHVDATVVEPCLSTASAATGQRGCAMSGTLRRVYSTHGMPAVLPRLGSSGRTTPSSTPPKPPVRLPTATKIASFSMAQPPWPMGACIYGAVITARAFRTSCAIRQKGALHGDMSDLFQTGTKPTQVSLRPCTRAVRSRAMGPQCASLSLVPQ